jgi:hypothetical protein
MQSPWAALVDLAHIRALQVLGTGLPEFIAFALVPQTPTTQCAATKLGASTCNQC